MSEPITPEQLAAIRERLAAATPGPWFLDAGGDSGVYTEARESRTSSDVASAFHREDEVLIAHAPEDIAALLAEVDRLAGEVKGWTNAAKVWEQNFMLAKEKEARNV